MTLLHHTNDTFCFGPKLVGELLTFCRCQSMARKFKSALVAPVLNLEQWGSRSVLGWNHTKQTCHRKIGADGHLVAILKGWHQEATQICADQHS